MKARTAIIIAICVLAAVIIIALLSSGIMSTSGSSIDEQSGIIFYNFSSNVIAYNVTAVAQNDSDGLGPSYLLNALSNTGYWYQLGLAYNWSGPGFLSVQSVALNPNATAPNKNEVTSCSGTNYDSSEYEWNEKVNPNDKVMLKLYFENQSVIMTEKDWNTGAFATFSFNAYGANTFVGGLNENGYFTGLMTEWYHNYTYLSGGKEVVYQPYIAPETNVSLFIDEFQSSCSSNYTYTITSANSSTVPPQGRVSLNSNGILESYDDGTFTTGS